MIELYEPAQATGGKVTYGADNVSIKYPSVSTCLTLTLVCQDALVGAHFGLYQAVQSAQPKLFTKGQAEKITSAIAQLAMGRGVVKRALLVGCHDIWNTRNPDVYRALYGFCDTVDDSFGDLIMSGDWETGNLNGGNAVDLEVRRGSHQVIITKTQTDGGGGLKIVAFTVT